MKNAKKNSVTFFIIFLKKVYNINSNYGLVMKKISIFLTTAMLILSLLYSNLPYPAHAKAVPLLDIDTGNKTLDDGLPKFYKCISKSVKNSYDKDEPSYFQKEPMKFEVVQCYHEVFSENEDEEDEDKNDKEDKKDRSD